MPCPEYEKLKNEVDLAKGNISYWSREGDNFFSKSGKAKAIKQERERHSRLCEKWSQHERFCLICRQNKQDTLPSGSNQR